MSRIVPVRRHSFANLEKAKQASAGGEGSGKKKSGRFKRWRKVSFSFGDTIHHVPHHERKQSISRSLSADDRPVGVPVEDANETGQIQESNESDSGEQGILQGIGSSTQNPDNSQVKR